MKRMLIISDNDFTMSCIREEKNNLRFMQCYSLPKNKEGYAIAKAKTKNVTDEFKNFESYTYKED